MASIRQERVAELLKRELSILFQRESNTWFGGLFITVTQVRIGPDLGLAKVYLSFMATPDKEKALKEVEAEGWRVRKALGAKVGKQLRRVPELNFYLDDSLDFVDDVQRALRNTLLSCKVRDLLRDRGPTRRAVQEMDGVSDCGKGLEVI